MRKSILGLVAISTAWIVILPSYSTLYAETTSTQTITIPISTTTRIYDLGPNNAAKPDGWDSVYYDDTTWIHPHPVDRQTLDCLQQEVPNWGNSPTYWGPHVNDYYLFRQDFKLPTAASYSGSTLDIGTPTGAGLDVDPNAYYDVRLNGTPIDRWRDRGLRRDAVGLPLHPGRNVLAIYAPSSNDNSGFVRQCSALTYTLRIHVTGNAPAPQPAADALVTTLPGQNVVLTGPTLPFAWHAYPHAAYYELQMWLVRASGRQKLTASAVTNLAKRLSGTHYNLSVRNMPKGVYHWRLAAIDGQGTLISAWTPEGTVTMP